MQSEDEQALARKRKQRLQVNMICAHMGLNVLSLCVALVARVSVLQQAGGLSGAAAAQLLALFSSGVGAVEFLLNPITGKLSDAYGRKIFLMQAPAVSAFMKLLVFLKPAKITIALERCLAGACTTIGGSTACSAALADIVEDPKELSRAYASLGTATGLGVIIGPMVGAAAIGRSGRPQRAFAAGAVCSMLQLALISSQIQESLAPHLRKSLPGKEMLSAMNPLSVLKLYVNGPIVAALVSIAGLQCFCEGKAISDLNVYYLLNDAKFSDAQRSLYVSCLGVVMTAAGQIGRNTIDLFGMRGHTTLQNIATVVGFTVMGATTKLPVIFSALFFYAFAMERRAATSSWAVKAGTAAGMGKGEFSAAFANLRAIVVGVAPWLYAKVYTRSIASKASPGTPYFVGALFAVIAEIMHRTLSKEQLQFA